MDYSWPLRPIGDLLRDVQSGFACGKRHATPTGIPHLRTNNIGLNGELDLSELVHLPADRVDGLKYDLKAGDVLFNNTNSVELVGKAALVREDLPYGFSNHLTRLRVRLDLLDPQWLVLCLRDLWQQQFFRANARRWIGQAGFNPTSLRKTPIAVPPITDQRRIVTRLEELLARLEEGRALHRSTLPDTEALWPALLRDLYESPEAGDWEITRFLEVTDDLVSGFACAKRNAQPDGAVHLRTHNIAVDGSLNLSELTRIPVSMVPRNLGPLQPGDILFNNTNSAELVGKSALVETELPFVFSNHITRIRVERQLVEPEWVFYWLQHLFHSRFFERNCKRWIGQAGFSQTTLGKLELPLPRLEQQRELIDVLRERHPLVKRLPNLNELARSDLDALEASLLTAAVRGAL
jgi:type I restriction enzyme, S subunit